jgi:hypothetical protein
LRIIGKAVRGGKLCYYIDDGVYHTYSGVSENTGAYSAANNTYFNGFAPARLMHVNQ